MSEGRDYIERWKTLKEQRESWINTWQDIRDFVFPNSGSFEDIGDHPQQLESRSDDILDGTASRALRVLGAGMQGGLTSPSRPWFRLGLQDEDVSNYMPIKVWLEQVEQKMYSRFARSNFYNAIHSVYEEAASYGQAAIIIEADDVDTIRFYTMTCGEYCLSESERGFVDTLYRTIWMQAKQIRERFRTVPRDVQTALDKNMPYEWFKILHCIQPRKFYDPRKRDAENMPYESVYIEIEGDNQILKKGGYRTQPMACPRWKTSGSSVYGKSPGHDILGDVKMLQQMAGDMFEGLEKMVRPPLKAAGGLKGDIAHMAGMVTYTEDVAKAGAMGPLYETNIRIGELMEAIKDVRMQIREGLYNDMFLMLVEPTPNMTATEVAERHEEKLLMLGPVIERQFHELLNPIIDRVYDIMMDDGELPEPPRELKELVKKGEIAPDLKVEFISLLAQAQKLASTKAIRAVSDYAAGMSQVIPAILDKFDHDKAIDEFAEATGAPPEIIRTDDLVKQIRSQKEKVMQAEMAKQSAMQAAQTGKVLSETNTEDESALTDLERSMNPM